jgi:hypothetical protein
MKKYIARQIEPENEDYERILRDISVTSANGDITKAIFMFDGDADTVDVDCIFNDDLYYDYYEPRMGALTDDFSDTFGGSAKLYYESWDMFIGGWNIKALTSYLEAQTGKSWEYDEIWQAYNGYGKSYCLGTIVYCKDKYNAVTARSYAFAYLDGGREFEIGILDIPDEQDDEIDLNDISSFEMFITDWVRGCFVNDDYLRVRANTNATLNVIAKWYGCSTSNLVVYYYRSGRLVRMNKG